MLINSCNIYIEGGCESLEVCLAGLDVGVVDHGGVAERGGGHGAVLQLGEVRGHVRVGRGAVAARAAPGGGLHGLGGVCEVGAGLLLLLVHDLLPAGDPLGHPQLVAGLLVDLDLGHHVSQAVWTGGYR